MRARKARTRSPGVGGSIGPIEGNCSEGCGDFDVLQERSLAGPQPGSIETLMVHFLTREQIS